MLYRSLRRGGWIRLVTCDSRLANEIDMVYIYFKKLGQISIKSEILRFGTATGGYHIVDAGSMGFSLCLSLMSSSFDRFQSLDFQKRDWVSFEEVLCLGVGRGSGSG